MPFAIGSGSHSVAGRRDSNEDAVHCDPSGGLFVVADGTGSGYAGGDVAAKLACSTLAADLTPVPAVGIEGSVGAAIARAHRLIREGQSVADHRKMATTAVILALAGRRLQVSHVGDSRAYLLRRGKLVSLTRDHSLANYLADNPGKAPKVQRPGDTLMRALGLNPDPPQADHRSIDLEPGDVVLACSDGVSSFVPEWAIAAMLDSAASIGEQEAARLLGEAALAQGSKDNISAVVLRAKDDAVAKARPLGWFAFLEGPRQGEVIGFEGSAHIGKSRGCQIVIDEAGALDRHIEIRANEHGFQVHDLGGGTILNDVRIEEETLVDGDVIRIGGTRMVFKCHRPS
jgi:PPM family protein phosphatase